jgi:integrase
MVHGQEYSGPTGLLATKQNESEAKVIEAKHRAEVAEGRTGRSRTVPILFSDASKTFLNWARAEHSEHESTANRIAVSFASLNAFFKAQLKGNPLSTLDAADIEEYKAWRWSNRIKKVTIRHDLHALSAFLKFGLKRRWIRQNPLLEVDIPSDSEAVRMHVLNADEENTYFDGATRFADLHDLARIILNQGPRPEEVRELQKPDIDLARGTFYIRRGKTKAARRTLSMTQETRQIFERRLFSQSDGLWVFPSRRVPGAHVGRLNFAHDSVCEDKGLSFCLYDLRHTFATRMAQAGVDLATLAAILGHSSLRLVMRYVHPQAEHMKAAMAHYDEAILRPAMGKLQ